MGTPLVDALADYREQLAPQSTDGSRPRRWRWWVLVGLAVLVLVVGGALALLRPADSTTTAAAAPVVGPADLGATPGRPP